MLVLFSGIYLKEHSFFIVPDVITDLVALLHLRNGMIAMISSIIGSIISAVVMFSLVTYFKWPLITSFVECIPGISKETVLNVSQQLSKSGLSAFVIDPLQGISCKIYSLKVAIQKIAPLI